MKKFIILLLSLNSIYVYSNSVGNPLNYCPPPEYFKNGNSFIRLEKTTGVVDHFNQFFVSEPIKRLTYDQKESISYQISTDVDLNNIDPSDVLRARREITSLQKSINIDLDGYVTSTEIALYSNGEERSQFPRPYKTISDRNGVQMFNSGNELYYSAPLASGEQAVRVDLSEIDIDNFGYHDVFTLPTQTELQELVANGASITQSTNSITISDGVVRTTVDISTQSIFEEYFKDGILHHSIYDQFSQPLANGKMVKVLTIQRAYSNLKNGGKLQRTVRINYNNYMIDGLLIYNNDNNANASTQLTKSNINNGQQVGFSSTFDSNILKYSSDMTLYPNPATNSIHIRLKEDTPELSYIVRNIQGQQLFSGAFNEAREIDIERLPVGTYLVEVQNAASRYYAIFVKE